MGCLSSKPILAQDKSSDFVKKEKQQHKKQFQDLSQDNKHPIQLEQEPYEQGSSQGSQQQQQSQKPQQTQQQYPEQWVSNESDNHAQLHTPNKGSHKYLSTPGHTPPKPTNQMLIPKADSQRGPLNIKTSPSPSTTFNEQQTMGTVGPSSQNSISKASTDSSSTRARQKANQIGTLNVPDMVIEYRDGANQKAMQQGKNRGGSRKRHQAKKSDLDDTETSTHITDITSTQESNITNLKGVANSTISQVTKDQLPNDMSSVGSISEAFKINQEDQVISNRSENGRNIKKGQGQGLERQGQSKKGTQQEKGQENESFNGEQSLFQKLLIIDQLLQEQHMKEIEEIKTNARTVNAKPTINVESLIAKGGFGSVYKGIWQDVYVAIKTILFEDESGGKMSRKQHAIHETAITTSMIHPNIVQCFFYNIEKMGQRQNGLNDQAIRNGIESANQVYKIYLVQEYCEGGNLTDALNQKLFWDQQSNKPLLAQVLQIALDIAKGIQHIHSKHIIHGDLKSSNVLIRHLDLSQNQSDPTNISLLDSLGVYQHGVRTIAKVADFGLSMKIYGAKSTISNFHAGTPFYAAPEILSNGRISRASDTYSFGVILWELYHHMQPYVSHPINFNQFQLQQSFPRFSMDCPLPYALLTGICLSQSPNDRPTFNSIVDVLSIMLEKTLQGSLSIGKQNMATIQKFQQSGAFLERDGALKSLQLILGMKNQVIEKIGRHTTGTLSQVSSKDDESMKNEPYNSSQQLSQQRSQNLPIQTAITEFSEEDRSRRSDLSQTYAKSSSKLEPYLESQQNIPSRKTNFSSGQMRSSMQSNSQSNNSANPMFGYVYGRHGMVSVHRNSPQPGDKAKPDPQSFSPLVGTQNKPVTNFSSTSQASKDSQSQQSSANFSGPITRNAGRGTQRLDNGNPQQRQSGGGGDSGGDVNKPRLQQLQQMQQLQQTNSGSQKNDDLDQQNQQLVCLDQYINDLVVQRQALKQQMEQQQQDQILNNNPQGEQGKGKNPEVNIAFNQALQANQNKGDVDTLNNITSSMQNPSVQQSQTQLQQYHQSQQKSNQPPSVYFDTADNNNIYKAILQTNQITGVSGRSGSGGSNKSTQDKHRQSKGQNTPVQASQKQQASDNKQQPKNFRLNQKQIAKLSGVYDSGDQSNNYNKEAGKKLPNENMLENQDENIGDNDSDQAFYSMPEEIESSYTPQEVKEMKDKAQKYRNEREQNLNEGGNSNLKIDTENDMLSFKYQKNGQKAVSYSNKQQPQQQQQQQFK